MIIEKFKNFIKNKINENLTDDVEKDSLKLSAKFENRLKELKLPNNNNKINVGDKLICIDSNKRNLSDNVFNFLKENKIFEVKRINNSGKLDLGYYNYITDKNGKKIKKVFYLSPRRFEKLEKYDKVSSFFLKLKDIPKNVLLEYPIDYFDIDDKGNIYFISRRNVQPGVDPFKSPRRQTTGLGRLLKRIVKPDYLDNELNVKDIEVFMNKWKLLFDDSYSLEILEGEDILKAYDFDMIGGNWFTSSCANFKKENNVDFNKYKVYTENTENIKCLVVYHKGKIYGRRMLFTGIQTEDHGILKKGTPQILLNYMYGEGGRGSKIDKLMERWAFDNKAHLIEKLNNNNIFRIKIEKTCYKQYPPWDSMVVNFEKNEIASRTPNNEKNWKSTYGARCGK
jgi:hypothetical protein